MYGFRFYRNSDKDQMTELCDCEGVLMKIPVPPEFSFNGRLSFYECYECRRFRMTENEHEETRGMENEDVELEEETDDVEEQEAGKVGQETSVDDLEMELGLHNRTTTMVTAIPVKEEVVISPRNNTNAQISEEGLSVIFGLGDRSEKNTSAIVQGRPMPEERTLVEESDDLTIFS